MQPNVRASVLIPSYARTKRLAVCLQSIASQTVLPEEVIVCWQAEDRATADLVASLAPEFPVPLRAVFSAEKGIIPAENAALTAAHGDILLMIDDDITAAPSWIEKHLRFFENPKVGAVGGPYRNYYPDGRAFARRDLEPIGRVAWLGGMDGNMYDHPEAWQARPPERVQCLMGGNMALRRSAFGQFESALQGYAQFFELDACLQVLNRGFEVWFDFSNTVSHFQTTSVDERFGEDAMRDACAYNLAFIHAKHTHSQTQRLMRYAYLAIWNSAYTPGLALWPLAAVIKGGGLRKINMPWHLFGQVRLGWRMGRTARQAVLLSAGVRSDIKSAVR